MPFYKTKLRGSARTAAKRQRRLQDARRAAEKNLQPEDYAAYIKEHGYTPERLYKAEKSLDKFTRDMRGVMQTKRVSAGGKMHHYQECPDTGEHKFVSTPKTRRLREMSVEDAEIAIEFGAQLRVDESQTTHSNMIVNRSGVVIGILNYRNLLLLLHGKTYEKTRLPNSYIMAYSFV